MRIVVISCSSAFSMAVCQGILDTDAQLAALLKSGTKTKGLPCFVRSLAHTAICAWPSLPKKLISEPLYALMRDKKVKYLRMPSVRNPQFCKVLSALRPDIVLISRVNEILPSQVIKIPPLGVINVHCSLLPQLRGLSPVAGAIIGGLAESGVTIHFVDQGVDTGDIILQKRILLDEAETEQTFCEKTIRLIRPMIAEVMRMFLAGNVPRMKQDPSKASYFSIKKIFGSYDIYVNWSQPSHTIGAFVRSGVRCLTSHEGVRLRILQAKPVPFDACCYVQPGTIIAKTETGLVVATGDTPLEIAVSRFNGRYAWASKGYRWLAKDTAGKVRRVLNRYLLSTLNKGDRLRSISWPNIEGLLPISQDKTIS